MNIEDADRCGSHTSQPWMLAQKVRSKAASTSTSDSAMGIAVAAAAAAVGLVIRTRHSICRLLLNLASSASVCTRRALYTGNGRKD